MEIVRGTLKSFNAAAYTATIQIDGSLSSYISGIAVAKNIPAVEMVGGRACTIIFFDPANPLDGVLIAIYE